jgi:Tfp pilus assembly protein PilN
MATTLMPLDPATTPQRAQRLLPIAARLLPAEIISARRARVVRTRAVTVLVAVTLLLGAWYAFAAYQAQVAKDDLDAVVAEQAALTAEQNRYADVVQTQADSKAISNRLTTLLADDVRWAGLMNTLRSAARSSGITITGMSGTLATPGADAGGRTTLPGSGNKDVVGTLTITGRGADKDAVAQYIDKLGGIPQLTNPYLTNVTVDKKGVQFSNQVDITSQALGGRFTSGSAATKGGK